MSRQQKQTRQKTLKQNPFITYRDEKTGQWVVIKAATAA